MLPPEELQKLADDIGKNGLKYPIVIHKGTILDGRNREKACEIAGVAPIYVEWCGDASDLGILSEIYRRHQLTKQQQAIAAVELLESKKTSIPRVTSENPVPQGQRKTSFALAQLTGVTRDAIEKATRIIKQGDASLILAAKNMKVSLDAAAIVAKLEKDVQRELVQKGLVKQRAKEMRLASKRSTRISKIMPP